MGIRSYIVSRYVLYPALLVVIHWLYADLTNQTRSDYDAADWSWILLGANAVGYAVFRARS